MKPILSPVPLQVPNLSPAERFRRDLTDDSIGYNPTPVKGVDEYAKLDAEDESLARWKASLGVVPGASGPASGPKVMRFVDQSPIETHKPLSPGDGFDLGTPLSDSPTWQTDQDRPPKQGCGR